MLPGRRLRYLAADIGTHQSRQSSLATLAIRVMTEMRDNGTVAFIGPDDTCRSEALVAAAWNLPMISYVSLGTPLYQYCLTVKGKVSSLLLSKTFTGESKRECNFVYVCMYVHPFQNVFLRCPTPRLHCFLSPHWPSFRFLSFMAFLVPSIQFFFGLPRALFCFGIHFNAFLGNLPSAIL